MHSDVLVNGQCADDPGAMLLGVLTAGGVASVSIVALVWYRSFQATESDRN
jgi:hypothetical protein